MGPERTVVSFMPRCRSVHGTERRGGGRPRLTLPRSTYIQPRGFGRKGGEDRGRHFIFHAARLLPNSQGQEKGDRTQRRRRLSQMADTRRRRRRRRAAAKEDQGRQGRKEGLMHTRRKRASPEMSPPSPACSKGTKLVLHTAPMQKGT